jgi:hypothetical protein
MITKIINKFTDQTIPTILLLAWHVYTRWTCSQSGELRSVCAYRLSGFVHLRASAVTLACKIGWKTQTERILAVTRL